MSYQKPRKCKKEEFSKRMLKQESVLIWIVTLSGILLAFWCVINQFLGELPWISVMISAPWAAYGASQAFYYNKAKKENTAGGIVYETALREYENNNMM